MTTALFCTPGYGHENPRSRARTAACVRVRTPSFSKIRVKELPLATAALLVVLDRLVDLSALL